MLATVMYSDVGDNVMTIVRGLWEMEIPHYVLSTILKLLSLTPRIGVPDAMDFLYPDHLFHIS